jgi:hypothetical protein
VLGLAALILAAASIDPSPSLTSTAPWWERFTFVMRGDGEQQACRYESSQDAAAKGCGDDEPATAITPAAAGSTAGPYTKITIERRFSPGVEPNPVKLATGESLLGGQVMALAIDGTGVVQTCKVIGKSGDVRPPYGCDEARSERFEAAARSQGEVRHGIMTVLVYGHEEYPV